MRARQGRAALDARDVAVARAGLHNAFAMKRAEVYAQALQLSEQDRLDLAGQLLASAGRPPGILSEDDPEYEAEIQRRIERVRSGESKGIPWEEFEASAEALLQHHRELRAKSAPRGAKNPAAASRGRTRSRG